TFSDYCVAASEPASAVESALELSDPLGSEWALGDLDGDHQTDIVFGKYIGADPGGNYRYRVELKMSREGGSSSFSFASTDGLVLDITTLDVDGDHDLDLVITGRFPDQRKRSGVWVKDGGGGFKEDLFNLYSLPADWVLHSSRFNLQSQPIDQGASRRPPACFAYARFIQAVLFSIQAECSTA